MRFIIDRCVHELMQASQANLAAARVSSVEDVRRAGRRLVAYSDEMAARVRELKQFLLQNMYRHYRVVRMGDKAGRILRDLFESYVSEPGQLPPHFQGQIERNGVHRVGVRLHRRHDGPLRRGRAPEALRPDRAGLAAEGGAGAWNRGWSCCSSTAPLSSRWASGPRAT